MTQTQLQAIQKPDELPLEVLWEWPQSSGLEASCMSLVKVQGCVHMLQRVLSISKE